VRRLDKRLEKLEALRRKRAGASLQEQQKVAAAISKYLEELREWRRSAGSAPWEPVSGRSQ
jgi:type II secretory pathway component PulM